MQESEPKLLEESGYTLQRHDIDEDDLRYIQSEIKQNVRRRGQ